jgi:hypothetical protein
MQGGEHMKIVDTLAVLVEYASPDLKTLLEEGSKIAEKHLKHAKLMAEKMMDDRKGSNPDQ